MKISLDKLNQLKPESLHIYKPYGRYYKIRGRLLPGVGGILETTLSDKSREYNLKYREKYPEKLEFSRVRGVEFHAALQNYLEGKPFEITAKCEGLWKIAQGFIKNLSDPLLTESPVWSETQLYAGTLDAVACLNGKLRILDWKTSEKPKWKAFDKYPLQLYAYAKALYEITGLRLDTGTTVVFSTECVQTYTYNLQDYKAKWNEAVDNYNRLNINAQTQNNTNP